MSGFRLINFEFENFDQKTDFRFSNDSLTKYTHPFCSLIIGSNGTGKSRLLRSIADAFNDLFLFYSDKNELFAQKKSYELTYFLDRKKYKFFKTGGSGLSYEVDGKSAHSGMMVLPKKLICVSHNISDKFPVTYASPLRHRRDRYENNFYSYLGIKVHRNSASPLGHVYRTLDLITSALEKPNFRLEAIEIFKFLELTPVIKIDYSISFTKGNLVSRDITVNKLKAEVEMILKSGSLGYSMATYNKLKNSDDGFLQEFVNFLQRLSRISRENLKVIFDFRGNLIVHGLNGGDYRFFNFARQLKIIGYKDILIEKNGAEVSFKGLSSGEQHILTSMLSISAVIEDQSLILIDEPETSLHPNWQMKYFDLVNKIFKSYSSCHFIVATHSHFLGSDLRPKSSSIVSLAKNKSGVTEANLLSRSTYGWSAEQILLEVFNVPTTRNLFVYNSLSKILQLNSKSKKTKKDIQIITNAIKKLQSNNIDELDESDPLKEVIDKLVKIYGEK